MASIKTPYAQIVRHAKEEFPRARKSDAHSSAALAEQRIIEKFRDRAVQDFRTLTKTSTK